MIRYPYGETVTLTRRVKSGTDSDGNDTYTSTTSTLPGVPVWPAGAGTELLQGRDTMTDDVTMLLPADVVVSAIDVITVYGQAFEVTGAPAAFCNPNTGRAFTEVRMRRVTG